MSIDFCQRTTLNITYIRANFSLVGVVESLTYLQVLFSFLFSATGRISPMSATNHMKYCVLMLYIII